MPEGRLILWYLRDDEQARRSPLRPRGTGWRFACRSTPAKGGARHGACSPAVCDGVLHTGIVVMNGVSTGLIVCRNKQALRRKQLHRLERIGRLPV